MSSSADVLMYDWNTIVDAIVRRVGKENQRIVENVLNLFGEKICNKYVILSSDHHDYNEDSLSPMCEAIDKIFNTDDVNDDIYSDVLDTKHEFIGGFASKKCAKRNDQAINTMMRYKDPRDELLSRDSDYWCCSKCGAINGTQTNGNTYPRCESP